MKHNDQTDPWEASSVPEVQECGSSSDQGELRPVLGGSKSYAEPQQKDKTTTVL